MNYIVCHQQVQRATAELGEAQRRAEGEEILMRRQAVVMTTKAYHKSPTRGAKSKLKKSFNKVIITITIMSLGASLTGSSQL